MTGPSNSQKLQGFHPPASDRDYSSHESEGSAPANRRSSPPRRLDRPLLSCFLPETLAIGSNLNEIVCEAFGKESLVRIQKAMLRRDIPYTFKRQTSQESFSALEPSRGFSK